MDILIKNMEMPSCCGNCQFNQFHEANPWTTWETCRILDKDTDDIGEGRLADCPLVALPNHGDLIDRQAVLSYFETAFLMGADMDYEDILGIVSNPKAIPTIVEATE